MKTVELLRAKSHLSSQCRQNMKEDLLSLQPDGDDNCKLKYSVNAKYCAGVAPYKHSARPPESVFRRDANKQGQERYESIALEPRHASSTLRWRFQSELYHPLDRLLRERAAEVNANPNCFIVYALLLIFIVFLCVNAWDFVMSSCCLCFEHKTGHRFLFCFIVNAFSELKGDCQITDKRAIVE